jgi:hypothetical protein
MQLDDIRRQLTWSDVALQRGAPMRARPEQPTCCLQDRSEPFRACYLVSSLQLTSDRSSSHCAPVGPSNTGWNDHWNDMPAVPLTRSAARGRAGASGPPRPSTPPDRAPAASSAETERHRSGLRGEAQRLPFLRACLRRCSRFSAGRAIGATGVLGRPGCAGPGGCGCCGATTICCAIMIQARP